MNNNIIINIVELKHPIINPEKFNTLRKNYRFTTYQDARRVGLVDGLVFETNILRVSPVNVKKF